MSTRANIKVNAIGAKGTCIGQGDFHVLSDGGDKESICECVNAAIAEWRGKVKYPYLARVALLQLLAISTDDYGYLLPGLLTDEVFVDYTWQVEIGCRGRVTIKQQKVDKGDVQLPESICTDGSIAV